MVNQETQRVPRFEEGPVRTIGLVSDTHIPDRASRIPEGVFKTLQSVDYIIHAGDLVRLSVLDELEQIAPVLAVSGNMDGPDIRSRLPKLDYFKVFDWKIGVTHNLRATFGSRKTREIIEKNSLDVLIYGHTHSSSIRWEGKTLLVNPGSPTQPAPAFLGKPTVGLLRITREGIIPQILNL